MTATGAHVVVIGNEKGGAGKSTVSMHLCVSLMRMGKAVGVIDLDVRQRSLTRYLRTRAGGVEAFPQMCVVPQRGRCYNSKSRSPIF